MDQRDIHRRVLAEAGSGSRGLLQLLLAALAAPLPPAWRPGLEERLGVNPDSVGVASSLLQLAAFFALGIGGFFLYMQDTLAQANSMEASAMLWLNPIHPFIYMATTPQGFFGALGAFGGLVRTLSAAGSRINLPDPTLALIEHLRRTLLGRRASARTERAKGERTRDVVEHASGSEPWDLRIVSYDRYDWPAGCGVQALGALWTVVGVREIVDEQGRLRLAHELRAPAGAEAVRGYNAYRPESPPRIVGAARDAPRAAAPVEPLRASIPLSPPDENRPR